jgi:hypothetical protein
MPDCLHLVDDRFARELAFEHLLPALVTADLAVVLERVRLLAELQRLEANQIELPFRHCAIPSQRPGSDRRSSA